MPKDKAGKTQAHSRLEATRQRGEQPSLPANPAGYITQWLFDIGPAASSGMGDAPIGYVDLQAWQGVTGVELLPWEARMLRALSIAYLVEKQQAEALDRPPPYTGVPDEITDNRTRVARQIKAAFAGLKRKEG